MEPNESLAKGSVFIVHTVQEGKHQYQVKSVTKGRNRVGGGGGDKPFVRKGDKLLRINDMDLQGFTPEELAGQLAKASPKLTVHKSEWEQVSEDRRPSGADAFQPVDKKVTRLKFSMEMVQEGGEKIDEDGVTGEDVCQSDEEDRPDRGLLVVTMTKTSVSVVRGRGCDPSGHCEGCGGTWCTYDDVVLVSESSSVKLVSRGGASFRHLKTLNTPIEHLATNLYLRGICSQSIPFISSNSEEMTIYYYKATNPDHSFQGLPVVLNFTGSDCFLRCCTNGGKVVLRVETCERHRLRDISKSDETMLAFLFYMESSMSSHRKFESALHRGWFIQVDNTESVDMATPKEDQDPFLFIIQP